MANLVIHDLADFPQWLPTISAWFHDEWSAVYGQQTCSDIEQRMAGMMARDGLPTALVAVIGGDVVGTVVLKEQALDQRAPTPCVAALFVLPNFRRHGIGAQLLRAAENRVRDIGHSKLYLFAQDPQPFYNVYGWSRFKETSVFDARVTVMEKWLTPQRLFQPQPPARRG